MSTAPRIAPTSLVLAENVRKDVNLTEAFKSSIATRGVRTPVMVRTDEMGNLAVVDGQRRVLAALDAGLTEIPYVVLDDVEEGAGRVVEQLDANHHRESMTTADTAAAFEQLRLFGLSASQIAKQTCRPKKEVESALTVAKAAHREVLLGTGFDLVTTAAIAEVAGDDEGLVAELVDQIEEEGAGQAEHILALARRDQQAKAAVARAIGEYAAAGVAVLDDRPLWDDPDTARLWHLVDQDGMQIQELNHQDCPGRAVYVYASHRTERAYDVEEFCTGWKNYHRKPKAGGKPALPPEEASAARKRVIESNKASDAAVSVRRSWMKNLLAAAKLPEGVIEHAAAMIARYPTSTTYFQTGVDGDPLDAIWPADKRAVLTRPSASKLDATRALLAHAFAIGEADLPRDFWRQPASTRTWTASVDGGATVPTAGARHLTALAAFGYPLSEVEATWLKTATQ